MNTQRSATRKILVVVTVLAVLAAAARSSFFAVDETQFAIVTTFGKPVRTIAAPGPNLKWPAPFQSVLFFDKRLQIFDPRPNEMFTLDRKNLVVDSYVCWRIADPMRFLTKVASPAGAENSLAVVLSSELSSELGKHELSDLFSTNAQEVKLEAIMAAVTERCAAVAEKDYGVKVACVGIKRVNLPKENKESVYERMRAEREQKAREYRAEGQEEATIIRAKTDLEKRQILSEAYKEAQTLKGEGDAEALRIYAAAYDQAPEFYQFMRTMKAYEDVLDTDTTVVLSADSAFLRLLTDFDPATVAVTKSPEPASIEPVVPEPPAPAQPSVPPALYPPGSPYAPAGNGGGETDLEEEAAGE